MFAQMTWILGIQIIAQSWFREDRDTGIEPDSPAGALDSSPEQLCADSHCDRQVLCVSSSAFPFFTACRCLSRH